jgi:glycosyltransferase involved in cell wall biosynthesis
VKVLFAYRSDVDVAGGAGTVMRETATALEALGVEVDVTYELEPDAGGYDLVHAFNIWQPRTSLAQLRHLRGTGVPVVWLPFYLHWTETAWAIPAVRKAFRASPGERPALLEQLARGTLEAGGRSRFWPNEIEPGLHAALAEMLRCVDHVCAISHRELQTLLQTAGVASTRFTLTRHGVDPSFADASAEAFRAAFGDREFVLCVGAVDARKNQLLLAEALRGTGLHLVLVGPCFEPDYLELVRETGGRDLTYFERLPRELVASAYKAARVHALPSFAEGAALANLEAGAAGRALVVSDRSSEFEYFEDLPYYCDPADASSIRRAVLLAWKAAAEQPERWAALAERMRGYTWERAARATLDAYRRTLEEPSRPDRVEALAFTALAHADELLEQPELLREYARAFDGIERATLVIYAPDRDPAEVGAALSPLVDGAGSADLDLVALAVPRDPQREAEIARRVDAVYSRRPQAGALRVPPRVGDAAELRRRAAA